MRKALLIGLTVLAMAGGAHAQTSPYRNPYGTGPAKDPYDLPKKYQGNPYDRDYSRPETGSQSTRKSYGSDSNTSTYGGYGSTYSGYGSSYGGNVRSNSSRDAGASSSRNQRNPACSRPGVVC